MAAGKPKPAFYVVVGLVVVALIGFAIWRSDIFAPRAKKTDDAPIDIKELQVKAENPSGDAVTTVKEYAFKPAERLPEVKGTAAYKPMKDNTVRMAINVWAGWA